MSRLFAFKYRFIKKCILLNELKFRRSTAIVSLWQFVSVNELDERGYTIECVGNCSSGIWRVISCGFQDVYELNQHAGVFICFHHISLAIWRHITALKSIYINNYHYCSLEPGSSFAFGCLSKILWNIGDLLFTLGKSWTQDLLVHALRRPYVRRL